MQTIEKVTRAVLAHTKIVPDPDIPPQAAQLPISEYVLPDKPLHIYSIDELAEAVRNCEFCQGIGYIRLDVPIHDKRFGKLLSCPLCAKYGRETHNRSVVESLRDLLERYTMLKGDLLHKTFKNFDQSQAPEAWQAVYDWSRTVWQGTAHNLPWLYLCGIPGGGKTHLGAAAANGLRAGHIATVFSTFTELCGMAAANTFREKEEVIQALQKVPVLIVDDILEQELATGWKSALLFRILDSRYTTRYPSMLVSNLPIQSMHGACIAEYEPRIASRLLDHQMCKVIVNTAEDYRQRQIVENE